MSLEKTPMESAEDITKRGSTSTIDLKAVRAKLQHAGPDVWRSLDEVSDTTEFKDYLHREFPSNLAWKLRRLEPSNLSAYRR